MSNEDDTPVIVSVSTCDETQEKNAINVYAQPVTHTQMSSPYPMAIGYASPPVPSQPTSVHAQAVPPRHDPQRLDYQGSLIPPLRFGNMNHLQQPGAFHVHVDAEMARVASMARSVKCLAVVDLCLVILLTIFQTGWIFLIWGPVFGYFGAGRLKVGLVYVYLFYWSLRALTDAIIAIVFGYWLFIISLLVDLYIIRYIWQFCLVLKSVPPASLQALQNAAAAANQTPQERLASSRV